MLYEKKLIGLFTRNFLLFYPNSQKIEGIFNKGLRKVRNNQLPRFLSPTSHQFFFFIGSQNRFNLLTYTSWSGPKSKEYKICSLCASQEHTHRGCISSIRKCINCEEEGNEHYHPCYELRFPIEDWGRISIGLSENLYAPEIVSQLNQPGVCLNSQVMTMDIGSETD